MSDVTALLDKARIAINQRKFAEAHQAAVAHIRAVGDNADAYFLLGIIHIELLQINKAIALLERANTLFATPKTFAYLAKCHALQGDMMAARDAAANAPVSELSEALTLDTLGVALSRVGDHDTALTYFTAALEKAPANPAYHYNYGVSAKFAGKFDIARQAFEQAVTLNPDYYQAWFALSDLGPDPASPTRIGILEEASTRLANHDEARLHIGHALAKELEFEKRYEEAFDVLTRAKAQFGRRLDSEDVTHRQLFQFLHTTGAKPVSGQGAKSERPLFVIGMPRSGTTLVERILSSHSEVAGAGELQDFGISVKQLSGTKSNRVLDEETLRVAEKLDLTAVGEEYLKRTAIFHPEAKRLVDKLPFNFFYVGLIRRALPNAKIICLLRDPMDTCIGNFRQLFSIHSPYYAYAYSLQSVGQMVAQFRDLMNHWQTQCGDAIYFQSYETLVTEPEQQIRQLLSYCGLGWEEACLHAERNTAPVSTASKVQVREPINTAAIGKWRRYRAHTALLEKQLSAYL